MKCRRCKTNFDYEKYYGICPKCAAYNRPDGKDELKEIMGEEAASYEEEYRPPVLSGGMEKSLHSKEKQTASFSQRLSNPYLDGAAKKKKQKKAAKEKKKGSALGKIGSGAFFLIMLLAVLSSFLGEHGAELLEKGEELFSGVLYGEDQLGEAYGFSPQGYSDAFEVCGRSISFGVPYEIRPEKKGQLKEQESLLIIPYSASIADEETAAGYDMDCYLSNNGLYCYPVEPYVIGELYHEEESTGTLKYLYSFEEKSLVFAGDFSELEKVELTLAFTKAREELPSYRYRVLLEEGQVFAEWKKEEAAAFVLDAGFGDPVIEKLDSYQGQTPAEGTAFYEIRQEFENTGDSALYGSDMDLYVSDRDTYEDLDTLYEEDRYGELAFYKQPVLPPGERGVKKTVYQISEEVQGIRAVLYYNGGNKEWQASL